VLVIDPRAGNATSNCAAGNIALLDQAVARLPGQFRHRLLVRPGGAGFSHDLLEHIATGGGTKGRHWEFSPALVVHRHRDGRDHPASETAWHTGSTRTARSCRTRSSPT